MRIRQATRTHDYYRHGTVTLFAALILGAMFSKLRLPKLSARDGLISRHRDPANRRNQVVALTADGEALFQRMLATVIAFDGRLRRGLRAGELEQLRLLLERLRTNVADAR